MARTDAEMRSMELVMSNVPSAQSLDPFVERLSHLLRRGIFGLVVAGFRTRRHKERLLAQDIDVVGFYKALIGFHGKWCISSCTDTGSRRWCVLVSSVDWNVNGDLLD